ncbi:hypothetical protein D3C72_1455630 [compost metagenome]
MAAGLAAVLVAAFAAGFGTALPFVALRAAARWGLAVLAGTCAAALTRSSTGSVVVALAARLAAAGVSPCSRLRARRSADSKMRSISPRLSRAASLSGSAASSTPFIASRPPRISAAVEPSSRRGMAWIAAAESSVIIRAWSRTTFLNCCSVSALSASARILRISAKLRSSRPPSAPETYSSIRIAATRKPPSCSSERSSAARSSMKRRCSGDTPGCLRGGPGCAPRPARSCTSGEP